MSTIRVSRRDRFTVIDRRAAEDDRLSFKARGILLWLLSKPNDWRCTSEEIARTGVDGRDAVRTGLKELEVAGYLVRRKSRDENGRWVTETIVLESPEVGESRETPGRTRDGFSGAGKTDAGKPGAIEKTHTEDPPTPQEIPVEAESVVIVNDPVGPPSERRENIRFRLEKRYGVPKTEGQKKVLEKQIQTMIDRGWEPVEIARRAEVLKDKWPTCDNPVAMLISRWDDWAPLTPGQMYGV